LKTYRGRARTNANNRINGPILTAVHSVPDYIQELYSSGVILSTVIDVIISGLLCLHPIKTKEKVIEINTSNINLFEKHHYYLLALL